ncbi:hypothetical protein [Pigmentiphaga daeguensis]
MIRRLASADARLTVAEMIEEFAEDPSKRQSPTPTPAKEASHA